MTTKSSAVAVLVSFALLGCATKTERLNQAPRNYVNPPKWVNLPMMLDKEENVLILGISKIRDESSSLEDATLDAHARLLLSLNPKEKLTADRDISTYEREVILREFNREHHVSANEYLGGVAVVDAWFDKKSEIRYVQARIKRADYARLAAVAQMDVTAKLNNLPHRADIQ